MTTYLICYLGLGIITVLTLPRLAKARGAEHDKGLIPYSIEPSWWEKTLVPIVCYSFALLLWPVLIVWRIKETFFPHETIAVPQGETFSVKREHLLRQMSIAEVECAAIVSDPLYAVPNLPFGHLNAAWLRFKKNLGSEDTLWAFAACHTDEWGSKEYKEGYAIVTTDGIGPHFLTCRFEND